MADPLEKQTVSLESLREQLQKAGKWRRIGERLFVGVCALEAVGFAFLLLLVNDTFPNLSAQKRWFLGTSEDPVFSLSFAGLLCLLFTIATFGVGIPLSQFCSRRKLERLCNKLIRESASPERLLSQMTQDWNKNVSGAAKECLNLLDNSASTPTPSEILVRAATPPTSVPGTLLRASQWEGTPKTLLRPVEETGETKAQELLRAGQGKEIIQ